MPTRPTTGGRSLFYTRDSGGEHETTPAEYIRWAQRTAADHGVQFTGTPDQIDRMIRDGVPNDGDVFVDFGVKGNRLTRPGLDALRRATTDRTVTHVFIPRRDRLARPDDPLDGLRIEGELRQAGITLVFMDLVLGPLGRGPQDIAELIRGVIDYDRAGRDRRDLARKMLHAQLTLARGGFSTGGRPPYGFRRWMVTEAEEQVRLLADGEQVRMARHHVVWLPSGDEREWAVIRRILDLLGHTPASRVAKLLTNEGVPTPDDGRVRTDNGVTHRTSGAWSQTTVVGIARNPLLRLVVEYGRRSMGDVLRFDPTQPRELTDADRRADDRPKVVTNDPAARVTAPARFAPPVDPDQVRRLVDVLDARAGTQRGKPRSRDPGRNPLGTRAFDLACGWPLYREAYSRTFRYTCGLYQQSSGGACRHNTVDGPTAARFALACVRQRVLAPAFREKVRTKLAAIAAREGAAGGGLGGERAALERTLADVRRQREQAGRNLGLAVDADQYHAVSAVFNELRARERELEAKLRDVPAAAARSAGAEVDAAMAALDRLSDLASDPIDYVAIGRLFAGVNLRLFLRFGEVAWGKRTVNRVAGGVVTFGATPPPVKLYEGPTGRRALADRSHERGGGGGVESPARAPGNPGRAGDSFGNVSRAGGI